jgi:hypothetical protein
VYVAVHQTVFSCFSLKQASRTGRKTEQENRNVIGMSEMFMHGGLRMREIHKRENLEGYKRN